MVRKKSEQVIFAECHVINIIHLFPLHKGDMKICSPEKSHISI